MCRKNFGCKRTSKVKKTKKQEVGRFFKKPRILKVLNIEMRAAFCGGNAAKISHGPPFRCGILFS